TKRDEAWHYTDLAAGLRGFALGPAPAVEVAAELPEGPRVVFVNGRFDAARSAAPDWVSRLGDAAADPARGGVVVALNTALAEDGVAITLAPGQQGGTLFLVALAAGRGRRCRPSRRATGSCSAPVRR
ncbi:FeS assembly protein SufD, partial [Acidiphilium sp. PM]